MTTDAWKALKRERRRRVCRGVWRTFIWTLGLSLAAIVVGHVIWFRFGWTELPLRCLDGYAIVELSGGLTPRAAASFETILKTVYGDASAKRSSTGRVVVRPAVVHFDDNRRLFALTTFLTDKFAAAMGSPYGGQAWAKDCRVTQYYLLETQRAEVCEDPWEPRVYGVIRQDSWPWLTDFFRVRQPESRVLDNLPADAIPRPSDRPAHLAGPAVPGEINCGPSFHDRILFGPIVIAAEIIGLFDFLWSF